MDSCNPRIENNNYFQGGLLNKRDSEAMVERDNEHEEEMPMYTELSSKRYDPYLCNMYSEDIQIKKTQSKITEKEATFAEDDGFKIKRIKKIKKLGDEAYYNSRHDEKKKAKKRGKCITIEELDIIKCYDELLEITNSDESVLNIMRQVLSSGNKSMDEKRAYFQKKWYHLKSSNLTEQEYRMKEKVQQKDEVEEINDIKDDILNKLASSKIKGFENKEMLLEKVLRDHNSQLIASQNQDSKMDDESIKVESVPIAPPKIELDEDSWVNYKKNQLILLDKLMSSDYFVIKYDFDPDNRFYLYGNDYKNDPMNQEFLKKEADLKLAGKNIKQDEFEIGENYNRREKRAINIKLSRYIGRITLSNESARDIDNFINDIKEEDILKINKNDLDKLKGTKTDKTYYNEKMIEKSYYHVVDVLKSYFDKSKIDVNTITSAELDELVNAVSFSLNGVHYQTKFRKTSYMIHPYDLLFILNKFKDC